MSLVSSSRNTHESPVAHGIAKTVALFERVTCELLKLTTTLSPILIWSFVSIDFMSVTSYPPDKSPEPTTIGAFRDPRQGRICHRDPQKGRRRCDGRQVSSDVRGGVFRPGGDRWRSRSPVGVRHRGEETRHSLLWCPEEGGCFYPIRRRNQM